MKLRTVSMNAFSHRRKKFFLFFLVLALFFGSLSLAGIGHASVVIWEEDYTRGKGKPVKEITSLENEYSFRDYTLRISNGGKENQYCPVTSAVIEFNGSQIVSPKEFKKKIGVIEKPIWLERENENLVAVELRSKPRCGITLQIIGEGNATPVADAGTDQTVLVGDTVQLDGSGSSDVDGDVVDYIWTGTPDPDDVAQPTLTLAAGKYTFSLVVTDDEGAVSEPASVTVTVLGIPELAPLPLVTNESQIKVTGSTVPGVNVIVRGGAAEAIEGALPNGLFQVPVDLSPGENSLSVYAESQGVESTPAEVAVTLAQPTLTLESITPETAQSGSILDLRGSGFTPDKDVMGVHFEGLMLESAGLVLEASETTMRVVVPFAFLKSNETVQVYVYNENEVSNSLPFHIVRSVDPSPDLTGNELTEPFDRLFTQVQRLYVKSAELVKPEVPDKTWELIEENFTRMETFIQNVRDGLPELYDQQMLADLDALFGSELFLLINDKLEYLNELLTHTAACEVSEVIATLNEIIGWLDWAEDILVGTEIGLGICCFFGGVPCCVALPVVETAREIIDGVGDLLKAVRNVLLSSFPTIPSNWNIVIEGPFSGLDPHILYTQTENTLSLYADFSNGGFTSLVGGLSTIGDWILDLLDIDLGQITLPNVRVKSIVERRDPNNTLVTVIDEGQTAETHTIITSSLTGILDLDIRSSGSCGPYSYPDRAGCYEVGSDGECNLVLIDGEWRVYFGYPEFHAVEILDAPVIEQVTWSEDYGDWIVQGKGFSSAFATGGFKVYWNDTPDWVCNVSTTSFRLCDYNKAGWLYVAVEDEDGNQRVSNAVYVEPALNWEAAIHVVNPEAYIGDTLYVASNFSSPYAQDNELHFIGGGNQVIATVHPTRIWAQSHVVADLFGFEVPPAVRDHAGELLILRLEVGEDSSCAGHNCDYAEFRALDAEVGSITTEPDQDAMAYEHSDTYLRTAAVGDLNGDGENDLVVGIPEHRNFGYAIGAVYIAMGPVYGIDLSIEGNTIDVIDLAESGIGRSWDVKIVGDPADVHSSGNSRRIGSSLAVGDIDGDGIDDLLMGTTDQDEDDRHRPNITINPTTPGHIPGKAYVLYGRQEWQPSYSMGFGEYDVCFYGDDERELGYQVALGNFKNDPWADIVISAPTDAVNSGQTNDLVARTYVIFGRAMALSGDVELGNPLAGLHDSLIIEGQNVYQYDITDFETPEYVMYKGDGLGKAVAVGDVNGDGSDDLLLGAPQYGRVPGGSQLSLRQGAAYLFYGGYDFYSSTYLSAGPLSSGQQDMLIEGARAWQADEKAGFGTTAHLVDLTNDGKGEIILGGPTAKQDFELLFSGFADPASLADPGIGCVYVVDGNSPSLTGLRAIEGLADVVVYGSGVIARLGYSLSSADVNHDGVRDLLVGAPGRSGAALPGHVWGLYGSNTPAWNDTEGRDVFHLEHRRWYSGDFEYAYDAGRPLSEGLDDFLFTGGAPKPVELPGFGAYVSAGDLSPYVGDDVLIVDPAADAPANLLDPLDPAREYSGMLHVFYEGSEELRPLPFISVKPSSVDFGEVIRGSGADKNVYIKNEGETTLHIDSISYSGDDAFVIQAPTAPLDIEPFEDRLMIIEFYPLLYTAYSGTITIHSNAPNEPVAHVNIQGEGIPESINPGDEYSGTLYEGDVVIHYFDSGQSGMAVTVDLNEMDGDVVTDEYPPITATLLDPYGDILAECLGGFLNVLFPEQGTGTLELHSAISSPIDYQLTLNIVEPEPLAISPQNATINTCQSEQAFSASGGIWPYNFELIAPTLPTSLELIDVDSCNGTAVLKNNECVPDNYSVAVRVVDGSGAAAEANVLFAETLDLPFTAPYYAYAETFAERGYVDSDGVTYPGPYGEYTSDADQGSSEISIAHGYRWWCYNEEETCCDCNLPALFNFPGDHTIFEPPCAPCTSPYAGWKASWAGVVADPLAGRISTLVGVANDGGPTAPYCVPFGSGEICYPTPSTWGYGQGYGYCRRVFVVQSDGTLQQGDPVEIQVNFTMEGSGISGMALLTDAQRVDWLEWQEYLQWDAALEMAVPDYASSSMVTLDGEPFMPAITAQVAVGDVLVLETLLKSERSLSNPGVTGSDEQWIASEPSPLKTDPLNATAGSVQQMVNDYGNQLTFTVTVQTQGAEIEEYPPGQ